MVATVTTAVVLVSPQPSGDPATNGSNGSNGSNGHSPAGSRHAAFAPVANRPLLLHVIDSLQSAGIDSILFAADTRLAPMVESVTDGIEGPGLELRMTSFTDLTLAGALAEARSIYGPVHVLVQFADSLGRDIGERTTTTRCFW
jgi:dTDP-glucose pyrophosphorylase